MNEYEKQAQDFLKETDTTFKTEFLRHGKHFHDDKDTRDIYLITLQRGSRTYKFEFGQSLFNSGFYYTMGVQKKPIDRKMLGQSKATVLNWVRRNAGGQFLNNGKSDVIHYPTEPTAYDVLACLTKYDPESLENFCSEYGYDLDSRTAEKIYKAVKDEWQNVCMLWNDQEIEQLQEIQ